MKNLLKQIRSNKTTELLFSFVVPPLCASCRSEIIKKNQFFCEKCLSDIRFINSDLCPACGGENDGIFEVCRHCLKAEKRPWKNAYSLMHFEGLGRELIHRFKYNGDTALAKPFGMLMAEKFLKSCSSFPDIIVPIPLHWLKYLLRGYNQSELLSEFVSKSCNVPIANVLRRKKWTRRQAKLGRNERQKNILNAFCVTKREFCKRKSILLIDDVITTGSTLGAATEALLGAGADEVSVLTLARG